MCHTATLKLPPQASAAGQARRFLTARLAGWHLTGETVDTALLLLSEAVTNAIVHAGTRITLTVALAQHHLQVTVADHTAGRPDRGPTPQQAAEGSTRRRTVETQDLLAESGRGLLLIDALAEQWDLQDLPDGKQLWFTLPVDRPVDVTRCRCPDGTSDAAVATPAGPEPADARQQRR